MAMGSGHTICVPEPAISESALAISESVSRWPPAISELEPDINESELRPC